MREQTRWPTKPPKGARCDATIGTGSDSCNQPVLIRCPNTAVETVKPTGSPSMFPAWLCADCTSKMEAKGLIVRNPKRKR
jgi:hypothetical protein